MSKVQFTLVSNEDGSGIIVYVPGHKPMVADDTHPNFNRIVEGAKSGDASVVDLFDVAETINVAFQQLSERVAVRNGRVYFDGDEIADPLTNQILRFLDDEYELEPLINFFEKVMQNPNEHSRTQLYTFLSARDFTITPDGDFVAYKGVRKNENGDFVSGFTGKAIVDGVLFNGHIPNYAGATVEMPRSEVVHDPQTHCSVGLHAGTYEYAQSYADGGMLEVWINPRDVVSVPNDSGEKLRVCRYYVVDTIDSPHTSALRSTEKEEHDGWGEQEWEEVDPEDERYCENCGIDLYPDEGELCEECAWVEAEDEPYDPAPVTDWLDTPGVELGDIFRDRDSRRDGRTLTVEMIDEYNGVAKCRSSSSGKLVDVSIDRLLSRKYERVN